MSDEEDTPSTPTGRTNKMEDVAAKRPGMLIHCDAKDLDILSEAAETAGMTRRAYVLLAALERAKGGMVLPVELARLVRAEAKRLKVPAEHVLSSWILAHVGKDGGE